MFVRRVRWLELDDLDWEYDQNKKRLKKLQMLAVILMTGAMKTTPCYDYPRCISLWRVKQKLWTSRWTTQFYKKANANIAMKKKR